MLQATIIGHLGADAVLRNENGKYFVSFRVSHNEKTVSGDGIEVENTTWVSCTINGKAEKLLPMLRKGTMVYVQGDARLRCYPSEKQRAYVAGLNIFVRTVQLCSPKPKDNDVIGQYLEQKQQEQNQQEPPKQQNQQADIPF